mgnify:CR=1 FL=1
MCIFALSNNEIMRIIPFLSSLLLIPSCVMASEVSVSDSVRLDSALVAKYNAKLDSLAMLYADEVGAPIEEISDNPLYFKLFMPLALYNEAISFSPENDTAAADSLLALGDDGNETLAKQINRTLAKVYLEHPELVGVTQEELISTASPVAIENTKGEGIVYNAPEVPLIDVGEPEMVVNKPRFWKFPGTSALKYTQSSYSGNWYKGGVNNHSLLAQLNQEANYAKNNVTLDNKLEAKLGYYTTEENDETIFKTNEDLLRITSKFGLKAAKSWYYSAQVQAYTQFMNVYAGDNVTLKSKFMAPAYGSVSVGMDFKPTLKNKNIKLSAQLSPVAYNCRYVSMKELAPQFGIDADHYFKSSIGSRIEVNWTWAFWGKLKWTGKAQFFTSYSNVEANWENTLDYAFNKYFSAQFFVHWRFDDSVNRDPKFDYNQLKEFLTLNFTYNW